MQLNHKWGYVAALYIWHNIQKNEQEVRRSKVGKGFTTPQQNHTGKSFSKQIISQHKIANFGDLLPSSSSSGTRYHWKIQRMKKVSSKDNYKQTNKTQIQICCPFSQPSLLSSKMDRGKAENWWQWIRVVIAHSSKASIDDTTQNISAYSMGMLQIADEY